MPTDFGEGQKHRCGSDTGPGIEPVTSWCTVGVPTPRAGAPTFSPNQRLSQRKSVSVLQETRPPEAEGFCCFMRC